MNDEKELDIISCMLDELIVVIHKYYNKDDITPTEKKNETRLL